MKITKHGWLIGTGLLLMSILMTVPALAEEALPMHNNIHINMTNSAKYDIYNNSTYYVQFKGSGKGLKALHITTDPYNSPYGQSTITSNYSGMFYITNTGDKQNTDNAILLVAVRGDIPDDFSIRINSSGYNVTPGNHTPSDEYVAGAVDQIFGKSNFLNGTQNWKPCGDSDYLLYCGQDMNDTSNPFHLMFIDLHLGVLSNETATDNGAIKVKYSIENLPSIAAFNVYAWSNDSQVISWTNNVEGSGQSGYLVKVPPAVTTIEVSPLSANLHVYGIEQFSATAYNQYEEEVEDVEIYWVSTSEKVGTINQNGFFEAKAAGTTTVKAMSGSAEGTAPVVVFAVPDDGSSSHARRIFMSNNTAENTSSEIPSATHEETAASTASPAATQSLKSVVTATAPTVQATEIPQRPQTPGFELWYAITGLLSAVYLIQRRMIQK